MKNDKRKVCILFLTILLLGGCAENKSNQDDTQLDVSSNMIVLEKPTDIIDSEGNALTVREGMTEVSVLGKETILIAEDRIYDDYYGLEILDNLWSREETDTILNTIKGTWQIDQYAGYIDSSIYHHGVLMEEIDTKEEQEYREKLWARYEEEKRWAKNNIPNLCFSIKERQNKDGKKETDSQYVYVYYTEGETTCSPISIILSKNIQCDRYPVFSERTTLGLNSAVEYPVVYIKFFWQCDGAAEEFYDNETAEAYLEMEKNEYKPATLILTSDGQFYILMDGAFYSLKKTN